MLEKVENIIREKFRSNLELEQTQRHTHGNQTGHHAAANFVHQLLLLGGQAEHAHLLGLRLVPKEANE